MLRQDSTRKEDSIRALFNANEANLQNIASMIKIEE